MLTLYQSDDHTNYQLGSAPMSHWNDIVGDVRATIRAASANGAICLILVMTCVFIKFPGGIPLPGYCSASMAAACQPLESQGGRFPPGPAHKKLKCWRGGFVQRPCESTFNCGVGHATFTADEVAPLEPGKTYT